MRPHEIAEQVVAASLADGTVAIVTGTASVNTRWARNALTTNGHSDALDVTAITVDRSGSGARVASLTLPAAGLDPAALSAAALAAARRSAPAWDAQPLVAPGSSSPRHWQDPPAQVSAEDLADTLHQLGEEFAFDADRGREHFGYLELTRTTTWLVNSRGVALRHDQSAARLELTVKSHRRSRSTWQCFAGADLAGADVAALAGRARIELAWQSRQATTPPGRQTVLLSRSAVADLMLDLLFGADARAAAEGRSAFSRGGGGTRVGELLASRPVRLFSDPAMPHQSAAPFLHTTTSHDGASVFDNGLPRRAVDWIRDGRLRALVSSRASAELAGLPVALEPDNLALDAAGSGNVEELIARTETGLLVTCTWYNRMVDPHTHLLTGLTRDGVYAIRGGEIIGRAGNFRFNESPVGLLGRIRDASAPGPALGREMADYFTRTTMPALLVDGFHCSSASDAV